MPAKPTRRQLTYLRSLANRTGQTFTYPQTSRQASAEIDRLRHTRPSSLTEIRVERKQIADQIATGPIDSTAIRADEIAGHGSNATWVQNRDQEPSGPPDPATPHPRKKPAAGPRTELARYSTPDGDRIVYGQRVDGIVRVTDRPSQPGGRSYLVERGLETKAELDALVADYVAQAAQLATVPMSVPVLDPFLGIDA